MSCAVASWLGYKNRMREHGGLRTGRGTLGHSLSRSGQGHPGREASGGGAATPSGVFCLRVVLLFFDRKIYSLFKPLFVKLYYYRIT